jgi:hypothetical protein
MSELETRVGVLRLAYVHEDGVGTLPGAEFCSCIAILNVLHAASVHIVRKAPNAHIRLADLIAAAAYLPPPSPGARESSIAADVFHPDTLHALILGAQSLAVHAPSRPGPRRWSKRTQEKERRRRAKWAQTLWEPMSSSARLDLPIARMSYESPFELVVVISLGTASAITSFAILVRALRLVYRNVRGFALDDAEIDAQIASLRALETERELDQALAESRLIRSRSLPQETGDVLTVRANRLLDLDAGEASIEDA